MKTNPQFPIPDIGFYSDIDGNAATVTAIGAVLGLLPIRDRWCVEFGAWDGLVGSTSRELILHQGYSAVLIEGDENKFEDLKRNYANSPQVITRNRFVGFDGPSTLDAILTDSTIPADFDLLTVDIDGNDYHVWQAVRRYTPKIVLIEFNPTIPPEVSFIQPADPSVNQGSSLTAIVELAKRKGYELISVIGVNAIFVRNEFFPLYGIADNRIEALWTKRDCITYFFTGYDGRVFLEGCKKLPWHEGMPFSEKATQVLPGYLRGSPYTREKRLLHEALTNPRVILKKLLRRLTRG